MRSLGSKSSPHLWKREFPLGHFTKYTSCMSSSEEHAFINIQEDSEIMQRSLQSSGVTGHSTFTGKLKGQKKKDSRTWF